MEQDLSTWSTIEEAVIRTGKGKRTIERAIEQQRIVVAKRPVPGRKAVTVIAPESLATLTAETLRPVVQSATVPAKKTAGVFDLAELMKLLQAVPVPLSQKLFLTEPEAALYLGFPLSEVKRMVEKGTIPSFRLTNKSRRIARRDLDNYNPVTRQVAEWRNGTQYVEAK